VALRRSFLVALTALVLLAAGYLALTISSTLRATGPAELRAREDAGDEFADD